MKIIVIILGILNGSYMLLDGIHVILKGKYIGPEKPGPWANLFYRLNIDVFKLGPLFMAFGLLWLFWIYSILTRQNWAYILGIIVNIITLWYIPVGTFISLLILVLLFTVRPKVGI